MTREKVGKVAHDLLLKKPDALSPIEQMRESLTDYDKHLFEKVAEGKKLYSGDFYLTVLTKKERAMQNVLRNYFFHRHTCPTPEWDQTVYRYIRADDDVRFLWVIPSKDTCELFRANAPIIDKSEYELLKFVLEFYDGTLDRKCRQLNGEIEI